MSKKVAVGMSGGVDSAVAAYLLKQEGYEVVGISLRTWVSDSGEEGRCCEISDARSACAKLDIPFHTFNVTDDFTRMVTKPFVREYLQGRTPNPCIVCNRYVKWDRLLYYAGLLECDFVATGHYAGVVKLPNGRYTVKTAKHAAKDQTYMIYALTQEQLLRTIMPLTDYSKEEVRAIARKCGLDVADKPDSQEICFVPDDDYAGYIENNCDESIPREGDFVDEDGKVLGRHKGIIHYTIGQRKGLGIAFGVPMYVKHIDVCRNEVVLAGDQDLYEKRIVCSDVNFMSIEGICKDESIRCKAKIRYHHAPAAATATYEDGKLILDFDEPVRAAAPGQSAVMYDENGYVIGGGVIRS